MLMCLINQFYSIKSKPIRVRARGHNLKFIFNNLLSGCKIEPIRARKVLLMILNEFVTICCACLNITFNGWFSSFFKLINQFFFQRLVFNLYQRLKTNILT